MLKPKARKNNEFADLLDEMADILEINNVQWKPQAYRRASRAIYSSGQTIVEVYEKEGKKGLKEIDGVGDAIADHIEEWLKTGKVKKFEKLRKGTPKGLLDMMHIEGLGPKRIAVLSKKGIKSVDDLKKAVKAGKIRKIPGFGEHSEENMSKSIGMFELGNKRMLIDKAMENAEEIINYIKQNVKVEKIDYAGSLRRMKETIGDIDVLAVSEKAKDVMDAFATMPNVSRILAKGSTKSSVVLQGGVQADLRVVPKESYAAALNYFTGSKEHNVRMRQLAIKKGWKLSEYGLFDKKGKAFALKDEAALYKKFGLEYIPPELREMRGEFENKIPKLVEMKDIKGDLHMHTTYTDGINTIEEMAIAAKKRGYEYIAITDHSQKLKIVNGLSAERMKKQWKEIDQVAKKVGIKILKGTESDILKDGSLDYPEEVLKKLDIVLAGAHTGFHDSKKDNTERTITALDNKYLNILVHPTGRIQGQRMGYDIDIKKVIDEAADKKKVLELDAQPARLDLNDVNLMYAKSQGVKISIDTDAHSAAQLGFMRYGIGMARRGWLTKKDVINTMSYSQLMDLLKRA